MNDILVAQVSQLERQLDVYTNVVQQQQRALHSVYRSLKDSSSVNGSLSASQIRALTQEVAHALTFAANSTSSDAPVDDRRWSPQRNKQLHDDLVGFAADCSQGGTGTNMREAAAAASKRIHETVQRLLGVWLDHLTRKLRRLLDEPNDRFQAFHDQPSEDTLSAFMDAFLENSQQMVKLLESACAECENPSAVSVPTGNPFTTSEEARRLLDLFSATIIDAFDASGTQTTTYSDSDAEPHSKAKLKETAPPPHVLLETARPVSHGRPTPGPTTQPPAQFENQRMTKVLPNVSATPSGKPKPPFLQEIGLIPRHTSAEVPCPSSTASTPRASSRGAANDSSQIWSAMGGVSQVTRPNQSAPCKATSSSLHSEPVVVESDKLRQLNAVLQQLEMQLSSAMSCGRNTGSEAKYYALSKKLQKVRAEVVKEQRELEELRRASVEREYLKQLKEENRRTFHR